VAAGMQRRVFLELAVPAALMPLAWGTLGCSKSFKCDGAGLPPADQETRVRFAYVDKSSDISKTCEDCIQFELGDTCGKCKVLPGPVHPQGTCTLFAPR
jgi:hypothetical protein